jgi:hypothetical protein
MTHVPLTIVRDPEESEAGEIMVDGYVGGHPYRFLLDTGAATSRVTSDAYTSTFPSIEASRSSGVFARRSEDLIMVPSIQVGPISKASIALARVAGRAPNIANLIGMDVLKDFCLHFDFAGNRLGVDPSGDLGQGSSFHKLFMDGRFHPYVDVQCGMATAKAVWDSGASLTIADTSFVRQHPNFFREAGRSTGTDSTGSEMAAATFVISEATIGDAGFPTHKVAAVDLSEVNSTLEVPMDLILGYSTLRHANWLLDFPRKRWAILQMHAVN